jgi:hypothetical protein
VNNAASGFYLSIGITQVPQHQRSCLGLSLALLGAGLSGLFLSNLTFGIVEIPDNLPFVGNLDEVLASAILFSCLSYLGINVVPTRWSPRVPQRTEVLEDRRTKVAETP